MHHRRAALTLTLAAGLFTTLTPTASAWSIAPEFAEPVLAAGEAVPKNAKSAAANAVRADRKAPAATFTDADGQSVELAKLLENGPVVLIFYRGGWCPYCVEQLKAFNKQHDAIEAAGGRVVAVSTELPEFVAKTKEKSKLGFDVLSDPGAKVSRAFGVAWANERYGRVSKIAQANGNERGEIPLGVTYVIDTDGTVRWAFLEHDYKKRATPEQVVEALNAID